MTCLFRCPANVRSSAAALHEPASAAWCLRMLDRCRWPDVNLTVPRCLDGCRRTIGRSLVNALMRQKENDVRCRKRVYARCTDLFTKPVGQERHES